jgi:tetratricopeptide (TPR) repeat protein
MKDFFVSYNKADRTWAEWISWQLEEAGHSVVVQAWDFRVGGNFVLDMQKATEECERTIVVLSPSYLEAKYTQPEWAAAFVRDPMGEQGLLVPVRVRECNPTGLHKAIVYADLVGLSGDDAKAVLLAAIVRGRGKPTVAPAFPGGSPRESGRAIKAEPRFPGALPWIWNVRHLRNPNFTGRDDLLEAIHSSFSAAGPAQVLTGLGGIGKTQVAVEYAYRNSAAYDVVWWVSTEEDVTLKSDYAALASRLGLTPGKDLDEAINKTRVWLDGNGSWLLVFDNARDPKQLRPYLPQGRTGHVLITSRNPHWRAIGAPHGVETWSPEQGAAFLERRTGQNDRAAAAQLATDLGCLPLAIEQAAAYIEVNEKTIAGYAGLFAKRHLQVLEQEGPGTDYPGTVATTWSLSMDEIEKTSPASAAMLNLCGHLAPDDIPLDTLIGNAAMLPAPLGDAIADESARDAMIGALRRFSLVQTAGTALAVHRLVQAVTRNRLGDHGNAWISAAVQVLAHVFPETKGDVRLHPTCERLLPHALAASAWTERAGLPVKESGKLLNSVGIYLRDRAQYGDARDVLTRGVRAIEAAYGPDDSHLSVILNSLGTVHTFLHQLDDARQCLERALAIGERTGGPNDAGLAPVLNSLALNSQARGDLFGAKRYFERGLAILEAAHGPDHLQVSSLATNLGAILQALGDLDGARTLFERALHIKEQAFGQDDVRVASTLNNLGMVFCEQGEVQRGQTCFERALRLFETAYGPDHPDVATTLNNVARVKLTLGEVERAQELLERVLAIHVAVFGENHPHVAAAASQVGYMRLKAGDLLGARELYERAMRIDEQAFGHDHPVVAMNAINLGTVLRDQGLLAAAAEQFQRALDHLMMNPAYGPLHSQTRAVQQALLTLGA